MLLVVFLAGYLVMALEILAFRIIQPFFGSSIYSTGAVLGVVLTALTIGYWLGGSLSVKLKPTLVQGLALIVAGIWVFLLAGIPEGIEPVFTRVQDPRIPVEYYFFPPLKRVPEWTQELDFSDSTELRMRLDPLIASTILFFLPSLLLATVGPCAIRALTRRTEEAGKISGWVFALGSLGSIAGVLLTSFWLISVVGVSANIRIVGILAFLTGVIAFVSQGKIR